MKRAALLLVATTAHAQPRVPRPKDVREPPPKNLKMRSRLAQSTGETTTARTPMPAAPPPMTRAPAPVTQAEEATAALRDLNQRVSFTIDLGYQVEAAAPTGRASLDRPAPVEGRDFDAFRAYGFGEVFGATRGVGLASLSSYFALRFQAARKSFGMAIGAPGTVDITPPIATWFERSGLDARYGWGELRDFLPQRWGLSKLRVRAGGQHIYGPWVMHVDGVLVAYDGAILKASGYTGLRHSDYTREQPERRPVVSGVSVRADLRGFAQRPLPLAVQADLLGVAAYSEGGQPSSTHGLFQGDWRPRRDVAVIASVRTLDGDVASQRLELRARYKEVTNLVLDLDRHTAADWRWDPALVAADSDAVAARRYLDMGPVVPRFLGSVRAGTLLAENIDLLLRGAVAADLAGPGEQQSSFAAPYFELGGAVEVRVRRTVALGASVITRDTAREVLARPVFDTPGMPDAIPADPYRGEDGFTEVGTTARLSLGARRFSSQVEFYGRRTRYAALYEDPVLAVPTSDVRYGGRITLDAWVGRQLRLYAAYDLSSAFDFQPEINGYKSLRLMITGVY